MPFVWPPPARSRCKNQSNSAGLSSTKASAATWRIAVGLTFSTRPEPWASASSTENSFGITTPVVRVPVGTSAGRWSHVPRNPAHARAGSCPKLASSPPAQSAPTITVWHTLARAQTAKPFVERPWRSWPAACFDSSHALCPQRAFLCPRHQRRRVHGLRERRLEQSWRERLRQRRGTGGSVRADDEAARRLQRASQANQRFRDSGGTPFAVDATTLYLVMGYTLMQVPLEGGLPSVLAHLPDAQPNLSQDIEPFLNSTSILLLLHPGQQQQRRDCRRSPPRRGPRPF